MVEKYFVVFNTQCLKFIETYAALCLLLMSLGLAIFGFVNLKKPYEHIDPEKNELLNWIVKNTNSFDEIASPGGFLAVEIPLLTGRGTYHGNGFPFEDRCLKENFIRYVNIHGVPTGRNGRMGALDYYNNLDITDFAAISPKPRWIVMNAMTDGAARSQSIQRPEFSNKRYLIFKLFN